MLRYGAAPGKILILAKKAFEGKYSEDAIKKWLKVFVKRFFSQQFKRSCLPDGPKVGSISLSPREIGVCPATPLQTHGCLNWKNSNNKSSGHRVPSLLPLSFHSKRPNKIRGFIALLLFYPAVMKG
ncbi:NAD synthetase [Acetivibrio straminisolvens JCM 21531]|uniref:NAD synthetase n=1 Tax=Acetivibrio straminisolvens JCM 21531 TaxID=1294263 RepID=W4V670_9FIRM|nr:NAD synthetase [Acetivibrio straminisolvens JCM 21531]